MLAGDEVGSFGGVWLHEVQGDVVDCRYHTADERDAVEEEGPAVLVLEALLLSSGRLPSVRHFVVHRGNVQYDSHCQKQGCEIKHFSI